MNKKAKKILLVVIVIGLVFVVGFALYKYIILRGHTSTEQQNLISGELNCVSEMNNTSSDITDDSNNSDEKVSDANIEENKQDNVSNSNVSEVSSISDEQKAIDIVKNDWGSDDGVYFKASLMSNGNYRVSVNNAETTGVIVWYTVNVNTGEFTN